MNRLNSGQRQAWLMRVLKNAFIDEHRASRRIEKMTEDLVREAELAPFTTDDLTSSALLDGVSEENRELLEQCYIGGMTSREIGEELGIPPGTVRTRLRSALGRLRRQFGQYLSQKDER